MMHVKTIGEFTISKNLGNMCDPKGLRRGQYWISNDFGYLWADGCVYENCENGWFESIVECEKAIESYIRNGGDKFVIQNGFVGNSMLFWERGGNGYSTDLRNAHHFTKDDAIATVHLLVEQDR